MSQKVIDASVAALHDVFQRRREITSPRQGKHGKLTFVAQGQGYVMVRYPRAVPHVMPERDWLALPKYVKHSSTLAT